jgi:hypothetical protein
VDKPLGKYEHSPNGLKLSLLSPFHTHASLHSAVPSEEQDAVGSAEPEVSRTTSSSRLGLNRLDEEAVQEILALAAQVSDRSGLDAEQLDEPARRLLTFMQVGAIWHVCTFIFSSHHFTTLVDASQYCVRP